MLGKKVLHNVYWHCSLTESQYVEVQETIKAAETLANLKPSYDYNVIKYDSKSSMLSLLWYPNFFEEPFPALETSFRIDLTQQKVEKRSYQTSLNPPILHRKELLLGRDSPNIEQFKQLTETAEQLGLFENPIKIGFKQAWDALIRDKGFQIIDYQFVPIGNDESTDSLTFESLESASISRHLTALSRSNLSAPMQCLARHGFLDGSLSVFDYGCGKGDDIRNLSANAITVSGWDPHYAPDQPKQAAHIVNLGFVINVIENYQERLEALLGAYDLADQVLVVSAMLFNQNAFKGQAFNDGVVTQRNTLFDWPFETALDKNNRWVKLSQCIPWDALAESYYQGLSVEKGRPAKDARLVIGAVIIKHKLCLSDVETVQQIQENPYLQYFVGLPGYQQAEPFAPSLFVDIRKRMGAAVFEAFHRAVIEVQQRGEKIKQPSEPPRTPADAPPSEPLKASSKAPDASAPQSVASVAQGKLIVDATVAEQAIRYPTDLSLLNEAREFSERIIDTLCRRLKVDNKPRTYREKARQAYLAIAKQKRPGAQTRRRGIKQQLQYLRRNLGYIEQLLALIPEGSPLPLPSWLLYRYWVIQHLYQQQWEMYCTRTHRCPDRIVSISQPYVRPIVRGKQDKPVEFGAKLSVSLTADGLAHVDHLRWEAFHEGSELVSQVEAYRDRHGHYPERVLADPLYGTRANRNDLKQRGIHFAGKPLGRPKQVTDANREQLKQEKAQRRQDYLQRIPIEGKFGQGKNGYRLNYIRAKRADTAFAWINSIFLVMNLLVLQRIFFVQGKIGYASFIWLLKQAWKGLFFLRFTFDRCNQPMGYAG